MPPHYFAGLDLGQQQDYSALAVLEQTFAPDPAKQGVSVRHYACRHLERFPLGTPYPALVPRLRQLVSAAPLRGCTLAVDQTGVGRAVVDVLRAANLAVRLLALTITSGHAVTGGTDGSSHVPKKELVGTLQVLLQSRRLQVAPALPEARTLEQELVNFRVKITAALHETFGAGREGQHDDLVLAVALAAWRGEREPTGGGLPYVLGTGVPLPRCY
jgi:hypothetical protein